MKSSLKIKKTLNNMKENKNITIQELSKKLAFQIEK
jgi:hypothetical protein